MSDMFPAEKLRAVDCLLESFCSTRTVLNTHATRTAQLVQLYYARDGGLMGGELQVSTRYITLTLLQLNSSAALLSTSL